MEAAIHNRVIAPKLCYGTDFNVLLLRRSSMSVFVLSAHTIHCLFEICATTGAADHAHHVSRRTITINELGVCNFGKALFVRSRLSRCLALMGPCCLFCRTAQRSNAPDSSGRSR